MVFNRKASFFLNLDEKAAETPVTVAPVAEAPAKPAAKPAKEAVQAAVPAPSSAAAAPQGKVLTTAEAIAAELAAEQAARPAVSSSTFAPDCVTAGGALPMRRRRGGANLAGFRSMAGELTVAGGCPETAAPFRFQQQRLQLCGGINPGHPQTLTLLRGLSGNRVPTLFAQVSEHGGAFAKERHEAIHAEFHRHPHH